MVFAVVNAAAPGAGGWTAIKNTRVKAVAHGIGVTGGSARHEEDIPSGQRGEGVAVEIAANELYLLPSGGGEREVEVADAPVPELDVHPANALRRAGQIIIESVGEFVTDLGVGIGWVLKGTIAFISAAAVLRPNCVGGKEENNK